MACIQNNFDFLLKITSICYIFEGTKNKTVNYGTALSIPTDDNLDTPAHLCSKFDFIRGFRYLKKKGADPHAINLRGFSPLSLCPDDNLEFGIERKVFRHESMKKIFWDYQKDKFNSLTCTSTKLKGYDLPYIYCIVANYEPESAFSSIISNLLVSLKNRFNGGITYQVIDGFSNKESSPKNENQNGGIGNTGGKYQIFLIDINKDFAKEIAAMIKEPVYNMFLNYNTLFEEGLDKNYEPFRDVQLQGFLKKVFSLEFDIHSL